QGPTVIARLARRAAGEFAVPALTLLGALLAWEAATRVFRVPRFIMPAPSAILSEGWEWRYRFIGHTWVTLYETLGGFALSMLVGVVGEFVGSDQGLGYVILSATSYWKTELAFSSMILLSLMAIVLFGAVALVERLTCPWLAPAPEE